METIEDIEKDNIYSRVKQKYTIIAGLSDVNDAYAFVTAGYAIPFLILAYPYITVLEEGLIPFALSFGVFFGAFFGGRMGDRFGRKTIYLYDMILMTLFAIIAGLSFSFIMFIVAFFFAGVSVGVDVPVSWSLIAEIAPKNRRAYALSVPYVLWIIGSTLPVFVYVLLYWVYPVGAVGFRIMFFIMAIISFVTWLLRFQLKESDRWEIIDKTIKDKNNNITIYANGKEAKLPLINKFRDFINFFGKYYIILIIMYVCSGMVASAFGTFGPIIQPSIAAGIPEKTVFILTAYSLIFSSIPVAIAAPLILTWISENYGQRKMFILAMSVAIVMLGIAAGFLLVKTIMITVPFTAFIYYISTTTVFSIFYLMGYAYSPLIRVFSTEIWPTNLRSTIQGQVWSYMRLVSAFWLFGFPAMDALIGFSGLLIFMFGFMAIILVMGILMPNVSKKSLEEIQYDIINKKIIKEKKVIENE